jgi:hypothetical protein
MRRPIDTRFSSSVSLCITFEAVRSTRPGHHDIPPSEPLLYVTGPPNLSEGRAILLAAVRPGWPGLQRSSPGNLLHAATNAVRIKNDLRLTSPWPHCYGGEATLHPKERMFRSGSRRRAGIRSGRTQSAPCRKQS